MVASIKPESGSLPEFLPFATTLHAKLTKASKPKIMKGMHVSGPLADKVMADIAAWQPNGTTRALFAFQGDIYQGVRAKTFNEADVAYANEHLRILSGLYGILRPNDLICPYRLEIGYGFPVNLYTFWKDRLAKTILDNVVFNLASVEYAKAVVPYLPKTTVIIEPQFFVQYPGEQPKFAAYHAKIARGAYAAWLIKNRIVANNKPEQFTDLGYAYSEELSSMHKPAYILETTKK